MQSLLIEGRYKLLMTKFEYLVDHSRLKKCAVAKCGIIGQFYLNVPLISMWKLKSFMHLHVMKQLLLGLKIKVRKNKIKYIIYGNFPSISARLAHDKIWGFQGSFWIFKVENCPHKHWQYSIGWTVVKTTHNIIL